MGRVLHAQIMKIGDLVNTRNGAVQISNRINFAEKDFVVVNLKFEQIANFHVVFAAKMILLINSEFRTVLERIVDG